MDSSLARAESDIYRVGVSYDASEGSSSGEFVEDMSMRYGDLDLSRQHTQQSQKQLIEAQAQSYRPPPIATDWEASLDLGEGENENVEVSADEQVTADNARVSFNVPQENTAKEVAAAQMPIPSASMIHFQNPKRYNAKFTSPYPTQSLRSSSSGVDSELEQVATGRTKNGGNPSGLLRKKLSQPTERSSSLAEVTPAFLRRAAQDLGVAKDIKNGVSSNPPDPIPPNSLMNRRDRPATSTSSSNIMNSSIPDSSFFGADASALDGTFVSIRDLNDDDDVPSVDNDQWNSTTGREDSDAGFPTETTSLLGRKQMPWQGGFFGSQMEKEDRRERRKMMRARKGWFPGWLSIARSWSREQRGLHTNASRGVQWEANHPIGSDFAPHEYEDFHVSGELARQRIFSLFLIGVLCFHMALVGLHDLFLRYLSYRNPNNEGEAEVSWNGEGQYIPVYWMSFEGRVLNPFVGPGARTLTAFGALVPGLVLSKGQGWRVGTSMFQTSSFLQLILHIWSLKTVLGGSTIGLEWKRGTFVVVSLYLISALIGSAWSLAVDPGRLITVSGMGITGLLAAAIVEQSCYPLASKDHDDESDLIGRHSSTSGSNAISSSSNEQFSFQPPIPKKKRRPNPLKNGTSPTLLALLEILASWWAAYTSVAGTVTAAMAGVACSLLLFVGNPPPGFFDRIASQDLLLTEDVPPSPPAPRFATGGSWRDDDDSADTSIGSGKQAFNTPLMRRSILADEDDDEAPLGTRASIRRRNANSSSVKTPGTKVHINQKQPFSASRAIARVTGVLLALLLTLIPASLIATGEGPSSEATRASALGCRPMRILYREDDSNNLFECAGGCIPLSRERIARKKEGMRRGRCDTIGYRCWQQSGTMTLQNYEVNVGIYVVPSSDGACGDGTGDGDDGEEYKNNDDATVYNGEVEGAQ